MIKCIDFLRDRLKVVILLCYIGLALLVAWDLMFVDKHHAHTWVEQNVPFFWSLFGFGAAAIIIMVAYWYGHSGIMARIDFYDEESKSECCGCGSKHESSSEQA